MAAQGYVLKDPDAPYAFERSAAIQKVKLSGPDINVGVMGAGFSLSTNPRRWGLATVLLLPDSGEAEYYVRTEVLEGDRPYRALQLVVTNPELATRVEVKAIQGTGVIELERYRVHVKEEGETMHIRWESKSGERGEGAITVPKGVLRSGDLQWLCSPWECPFGLSLRGDLWPLDGATLRHPVGRPEPRDQWDTRDTASAKFAHAAELARCVEEHALRRVRRLRALPPERPRIEEVARTAGAWVCMLDQESEDRWPQLPPGAFTTISGLSEQIRLAGERLAQPDVFRALTLAEREVLAGLPPHSQWERMHAAAPPAEDEDDEEDAGLRARFAPQYNDRAYVQQRVEELRAMGRPIVPCACVRTGAHVCIPWRPASAPRVPLLLCLDPAFACDKNKNKEEKSGDVPSPRLGAAL